MKAKIAFQARGVIWLLTSVVLIALSGRAPASPTNIFSTQFESTEGYSTNYELVGQNSWTGSGTGGNGLVKNFIAGQGQQAYVGYFPPEANGDQLVVWRPINYSPVAAGLPLVKFSVLMSIQDSANGEYDNFRWSVYNIAGSRLFSLDFDNYTTNISYLLDGTNIFVSTGVKFVPNATNTLLVTMDFSSNRWSAMFGTALLATNKPITTTSATLTLGDVDAVWIVFDPQQPGDNFLLFDNYKFTAESVATPALPASQMQFLGRSSEGWSLLRVLGPNTAKFAIEATTNFVQWTAIKTNTVSGGYFDHVDTSASTLSRRFYRARFVP